MIGETEVTPRQHIFKDRERTHDEHLLNVEAILVGTFKLIVRARSGEETSMNTACAAYWLESAAAELRALLKDHKA